MYILISKPKYPTPNQVRNNIPIDFVRNPTPVNPKLITLPLYITIYIPANKCNIFNNIGAIIPNKIY